MKFSIALGLLLAGFVHSKAIVPNEVKLDTFLRDSQHISTDFELVSFKQNNDVYSLVYKNGPSTTRYEVKGDKDDYKIVELQKMMSFSNSVSFQTDMKDQRKQIMNKMDEAMKQFEQQMGKPLLLGADDHDLPQKSSQPLIGAGQHDLWQQVQPIFEIEIELSPMVGDDDHDNWETKIEKALFEETSQLRGSGDHDQKNKKECKGKKHQGNAKQKHSKGGNWRHPGEFTKEEILPYLQAKLPDFATDDEIIYVSNNGFQRGKGFDLSILYKNQKGQNFMLQALYRPLREEFFINKIERVENQNSILQTGKQLLAQFLSDFLMILPETIEDKVQPTAQKSTIQTVYTSPPSFIEPKVLLGGSNDPDHKADLMKPSVPIEKAVQQNNHISLQKINNQPLLGGDHDFKTQVIKESKADIDELIDFKNPAKGMLDLISKIQTDFKDIDQDSKDTKLEVKVK